jgi:hypothetical protein
MALSKNISNVVEKLDRIYNFFINNAPYNNSHSPLTLSEIGEQTRQKINADAILKKYKNALMADSGIESLDNPYDIQELAFKLIATKLFNLLNKDEMLVLKTKAFNQGKYVENMKAIFRILLRDELLKDKNIPIEEIEKHPA